MWVLRTLKKTILAHGQYSKQIKQVIEDGSVPLADISLGVKQGHDYANQRLPIAFLKVVINHNGDLIAYCKYCDEYVSYNEMSAKAREAYGIIPFCRPCYNLYKRTLSSMSAKAPSITKSFSPQEIEEYVDITNKVWNDAPKFSLEDMNKIPGNSDKNFIYMSKCDTPDAAIMKNIRDKLNKPHLDQLVYIGQTIGNDINYNGSGTGIEILKNDFGIDFNSDGTTKVIDVVDTVQVNIKERDYILKTGATTIGLNILEGSSKVKKTSINFYLEPLSLEETEIYEKSRQTAEGLGMTPEQFDKGLWRRGFYCFEERTRKDMKKFFKIKQDEISTRP